MFNSAIIDTLIGLMLMYAALALVASGITEMLGMCLRTRPKLLEKAIGQFLGDDLFQRFYTHPRIALLTQAPNNVSPGRRLPSYLSSQLLEVLSTIWPAVSGMQVLNYESVGTLKFIDWNNRIVDDSVVLAMQRFAKLFACLANGQKGLLEIGDAHSLEGGYSSVICR